ncbi:SEC-C metal-binding domain-containing protein [Rossellomorea aquimaris]|uniref:YecA family protein n=1 Tax=Rossellomorea aquimaris TaxID=189382 RepID=UPI00292A4661|nr:SEC-C metal-binding domain-containing protein [Rossellomorea aquimaris]
MNRFVERVKPYFLSEDPFVQRYAIEMLEGSYLVNGDTFLTGLKAHDLGPVSKYSSPVLPYIMYMPLNEEGMKEIVNRLKSLSKKNTDVLFYIQLIANADTDLLISYRNEVKPFIDEGQLKKIAKLPALNDEELFMELADIMFYLDTNDYDQVYFDHGKRVVQELVKKGEIKSWEVQIEEDELVGFDLVYTVYMAGEIREESVIPQLVSLFKNEEAEDLLLEEVANALVKIGTDQVVHEVEKVALYGNTYFYTLDVLGRIKSAEAEQALLRLFDQTANITAKTLISDYLCQQLSTDAIPKIEAFIEEGYDENMLCLEESLYVNCVMNGIVHPKLTQWKSLIEEVEKHSLDEQPLLVTQPVQTEDKVGRNDPCPCGSGKKYKKCCL